LGATVWSIALQRDGKIVVGGDITFAGVTRLNPDGSVDSSFNPGGRGADDDTYAVALQADGDVLIGGFFARVNNVLQPRLARLNGNVPLLNPVKSGSTFMVSAPTVPGKFYTLQYQNTIGGTWTPITATTISGNGSARLLQDTNATVAQRFYRVSVTGD